MRNIGFVVRCALRQCLKVRLLHTTHTPHEPDAQTFPLLRLGRHLVPAFLRPGTGQTTQRRRRIHLPLSLRLHLARGGKRIQANQQREIHQRRRTDSGTQLPVAHIAKRNSKRKRPYSNYRESTSSSPGLLGGLHERT